MSPAPDSSSDQLLAGHCLARDDLAWFDLVAKYELLLLYVVRRTLGPYGRNAVLAGELVQNMWSQLIDEDFRLLRVFAKKGGCLKAYLCKLAWRQAQNYRRHKERRREHDRLLALMRREQALFIDFTSAEKLEEFRALLSPALREAFEWLLGERHDSETIASAATLRKRKERICKLWNDFQQSARS